MFDKKPKSCVKHIHSVTDDGFYNQKALYTVKIVFYSSSKNELISNLGHVLHLFLYLKIKIPRLQNPYLATTKKDFLLH